MQETGEEKGEEIVRERDTEGGRERGKLPLSAAIVAVQVTISFGAHFDAVTTFPSPLSSATPLCNPLPELDALISKLACQLA